MTDPSLFEKYKFDMMPVLGQAFGVDAQGRKVGVVARSVKVATEYMMDYVRQRSGEEASQQALSDMVAMLNESIRDPRYHVTAEYLLDNGNYYSYEFNLIVNRYGKAIS